MAAVESDGIDRLGDRRAFKAKVLGNGRSTTGRRLGTAGFTECAEAVEVDGLGDLVEEEDAKAAVK
jgi:hypothetical protein